MVKIEKLDRRHSGHTIWSHRAWIHGLTKAHEYNQLRNKCWETWGPACSRDELWEIRKTDASYNPAWCWHFDYKNNAYYVYFKGNEAISSWFVLMT